MWTGTSVPELFRASARGQTQGVLKGDGEGTRPSLQSTTTPPTTTTAGGDVYWMDMELLHVAAFIGFGFRYVVGAEMHLFPMCKDFDKLPGDYSGEWGSGVDPFQTDWKSIGIDQESIRHGLASQLK